jgi:hypothetical protein
MPENIYSRIKEWGCKVAPVRFKDGWAAEQYIKQQTLEDLIAESIVLTNFVHGVLDGPGDNDEATALNRECANMLDGVSKRLKSVAAAFEGDEDVTNRDEPEGKVVIEDHPISGYILASPNGQIVISQYRVGPRAEVGVDGFDQFAVIETARATAKRFNWQLVDHTATGILNPWADVGGKDGAA